VYQAYIERRKRVRTPALGTTLVSHWRSMLIVLLVKAGENALFYVFTTFYVVYVTRVLRQPRTVALEAVAIGSVVDAIVIVAAGAWSDRVGRRVVTAIGFVAAAAWAFALFPLTRGGAFAAIAVAAGIAGACHGLIVGGMSAFFVELFPTNARYTAFSIGYQLATVFTGAVAPLIGVALLNAYGSTIPVSLYALAMTAPGLISLGMANETTGTSLDLDG
jgi:MFS family permease